MSSLIGKRLSKVLGIANADIGDYKVHCARFSYRYGHTHTPLEVLMNDPAKHWLDWNSNAPRNNTYGDNRYIISLARIFKDDNTWLFGGVFEIRKPGQRVPYPWTNYKGHKTFRWRYPSTRLNPNPKYDKRLVIGLPYRDPQSRIDLEGVSSIMIVEDYLRRAATQVVRNSRGGIIDVK